MKKKTLPQKNTAPQAYLYDEHGNKIGVSLQRKVYEKLIEAVNDYHDYKTVQKLQKKKSK